MSDWQQIETAPKDGEFLVMHQGRIRQVSLYGGPHSLSSTVIDAVAGRMWNATHWMPLPEPPK